METKEKNFENVYEYETEKKRFNMKKIFLLALCTITLSLVSCDNKNAEQNIQMLEQLNAIKLQVQAQNNTFKLYPTKNMWTFLELNTATGQIWIVQWSTEDEKQFRYTLDDNVRISEADERVNGRFSLHATENLYNFILLDNINGDCWQAQWNFDEDKRFVIPIL